MEEEIFKPIKDYEGFYEVSNLGKVKSLAKTWSAGRKSDSILKPGHRKAGYDFVVLCVNKVKEYASIHRLVAEHFCDNPFNYKVVNHINGNKFDNRSVNLEWCTTSHNCQHAYDTGLKEGKRGIENHMAKLKQEDIPEIKLLSKMGVPQTEIGKKFGVGQQQISRIVTNQRWKYI